MGKQKPFFKRGDCVLVSHWRKLSLEQIEAGAHLHRNSVIGALFRA